MKICVTNRKAGFANCALGISEHTNKNAICLITGELIENAPCIKAIKNKKA